MCIYDKKPSLNFNLSRVANHWLLYHLGLIEFSTTLWNSGMEYNGALTRFFDIVLSYARKLSCTSIIAKRQMGTNHSNNRSWFGTISPSPRYPFKETHPSKGPRELAMSCHVLAANINQVPCFQIAPPSFQENFMRILKRQEKYNTSIIPISETPETERIPSKRSELSEGGSGLGV